MNRSLHDYARCSNFNPRLKDSEFFFHHKHNHCVLRGCVSCLLFRNLLMIKLPYIAQNQTQVIATESACVDRHLRLLYEVYEVFASLVKILQKIYRVSSIESNSSQNYRYSLGPGCQRVNNVIHLMNHYPADKC